VEIADDDWVFGFDHPHSIGSAHTVPCEQCKEAPEERGYLFGPDGKLLVGTAMLIVAEATEIDWRDCLLRRGSRFAYLLPSHSAYFYFVRPD